MIFINLINKNKKTISELAADQIVDFIIENDYGPGDKLPTESELCEKLGISRSSLREAIKILTSTNVLVIKRGKGTYISEEPGVIDDPWGFVFIKDKEKLYKDLWEMRLIIEPYVASMAAKNATLKDIEAIKSSQKKVENLINLKKDYENEDIKFHVLIAKSSGNYIIEHLIPIINYGVRIFLEKTEKKLLEGTIQTHKEIVEAIESRDSNKAYSTMKKHLMMNIDHINKLDLERNKKVE